MQTLLSRLTKGERLTQGEFALLLSHKGEEIESVAGEVARSHFGNTIFLRGLIEISNICKRDCYYCGIRSGNVEVNRYRLDHRTIMETCEVGHQLGFQTFVLQGGEDPYWQSMRLVRLVHEIRASFPEVAITLSLGEMDGDIYRKLYEAGANRYLLRHETINPDHFAFLHPASQTIHHRVEALRTLKEIGFETGAGGMVGSPGQTLDHLAEDLCFIQEFQPAMIGIGPFIPHHSTPFRDFPTGSLEMTLRMVALCRLVCPKANIPATTAVASVGSNGRKRAIEAGANVVMPNLSPPNYRQLYQLYDHKATTGSEAAEGLMLLKKELIGYGYVAH